MRAVAAHNWVIRTSDSDSAKHIIRIRTLETRTFVVITLMFTDTVHAFTTGLSFEYKKENVPNVGVYCTTQPLFSSKVPLHRCKLNCIQSLKCTAVNYNKSDGTCIEISAPRVLADNDLTMMYIMFNERVHKHCFTWVMRRELIAHHSREVYNRNGKATVARILYNSEFYPAYANSRGSYTATGIQLINTVDNVCEVLVLSPSCTTAWVPYEAGQPIPTRAETAGYTTEGEVTYPVMFAPNGEPDNYLIGCYTAANGYGMLTHTSARHFVSQMMMLVLLWGGMCLKCVHWKMPWFSLRIGDSMTRLFIYY